MNLFRKKKIIKFDEREVEVYEVSVKTLLKITNNEYQTNNDILLDHTDLEECEIENLSVEAIKKLSEIFNEVNKQHFGENEEGKEEGK